MYKKISTFMKVLIAISMALVGFSTAALSEEDHHASHAHEWEFGVSAGYANLKTEGEEGTFLDLHLLKRLEGDGFEKYFSVGLGAEMIVSDEKHYAAMVVLAYHPTEDLLLSVAPGFEWAKHEGSSWKREYATHIEAVYNVGISGAYHIGPMIGYSKTSEAEEYSVGIHIGIPL